MQTLYVNIDNSYTGTGHTGTGTPGGYNPSTDDPLSFADFMASINSINVDTTYYVRGFQTLIGDVRIYPFNIAFINIKVLPWENSPWVLFDNIVNGAVVAFGVANPLNMTVKGMAVHSGPQGTFAVDDTGMSGSASCPLVFDTCYISFDNYFSIDNTLRLNNDLKFNGCVIYATNPLAWIDVWGLDYTDPPKLIQFNACYWGKFVSQGGYNNYIELELGSYRTSLLFNRCVFENDLSFDMFFDSTARTYLPLSSGSLTSCETSHVSSLALPLVSDATLANKTDFTYTNFGLSQITDPAIIAEWIAGDYNEGLYGGQRQGYGAFYFPLIYYTNLGMVTGTGHSGTINDAWSIQEFHTYISSGPGLITPDPDIKIIFFGKVNLSDLYTASLTGYYDFDAIYSVALDSLTPKTLGPAIFYLPLPASFAIEQNSWVYIDVFGDHPGSFEILNLVGNIAGLELSGYSIPPAIGPFVIKNCYFACDYQGFEINTDPNDRGANFYGCTFAATRLVRGYGDVLHDPITDEFSLILVYNTQDGSVIRFYDCVFNIAYFLYYNPKNITVEFYNCKFSNSYNYFMQHLMSNPYVTLVVDSKCEFNFDFGTHFFPEPNLIDVNNKAIISSSSFNIPVETDPTILQRWIDNNYNTGLFGETRLGVGTFYFTESVTTTTTTSTTTTTIMPTTTTTTMPTTTTTTTTTTTPPPATSMDIGFVHIQWPTHKYLLLQLEDNSLYKAYIDAPLDTIYDTGDFLKKYDQICRNVSVANNDLFPDWNKFDGFKRFNGLDLQSCILELIHFNSYIDFGAYFPSGFNSLVTTTPAPVTTTTTTTTSTTLGPS
jgi:hypothetical protein